MTGPRHVPRHFPRQREETGEETDCDNFVLETVVGIELMINLREAQENFGF